MSKHQKLQPVTVKLDELGLEGQFVKMHNPKLLTYEEIERMESGDVEAFGALIQEWNLTDRKGHPLPAPDEPGAVKKVPFYVIEFLGNQIGEAIKVPNA